MSTKTDAKSRYSEYPASDLNKRTAEILGEVQHGKLPVIITKHEKPVAFIAPISMLEKIERSGALLESLREEGTRIETVTRELRKATQAAHARAAREEQEESAEERDVEPERAPTRDKTMAVTLPRKVRR